MKNSHKISMSVLLVATLMSGCSSMDSNNITEKSVVATTQGSQAAPTPQVGYRFSDAENSDIANPNKLSYRIFYEKPSIGANAAWFDAVKKGDLPTVKYIVENGQNLEVKDTGNLGQTALGWAAFIGYEDMVDYLIDEGASLYATDSGDVYNVLKSAALGKNTNVVKKVYALINAEAPIDLNDQTVESDGETLVMVAASNNRLETVAFLLSKGSDPNLVSAVKDQGAYLFACDRGYIKMQQLLANNGAINHRTGAASCN